MNLVFERFGTSPRSVDRVQGIIRDVRIIGPRSRNNRVYPLEVLRASASKYEGVKVNVDHPPSHDPNRPRGVADRIGAIRNVRFVEGSGLHGDFYYNPKHPLAEQVAWAAENDPASIGFSHNAMVKPGRDGRVDEIQKVVSVDLVADPATTNGLFESASFQPLAPGETWGDRLLGRRPSGITEQQAAPASEDWGHRLTGRRPSTVTEQQAETVPPEQDWSRRLRTPM